MKKLLILFLFIPSLCFGATIFDDTFTGSAAGLETHSPDTGTSWTEGVVDPSDGDINLTGSGTAQSVGPSSSGDSYYLANATYGTANYSVQLSFTTLTNPGTDSRNTIIGCRYTSASGGNGYFAWIEAAADTNDVRIYRLDNGTPTKISGAEDTSPTTNDVFKMVCNGTSISLQKNGSDVITPITDATHSATGVAILGAGEVFGLTTGASPGAEAIYTRFLVESIDSARRAVAPMVLQ